MEEIEVKFLNIDREEMEKKLLAIGAEKVGEYFYRRHLFDYPDLRLNKTGAYVRLRDEGEKVTLTFKQRLGMKSDDGTVNDEGMKELEVVVDDFEKTAEIFFAMGFIEKFYQENKRIRFRKGTTEFDIDIWPQLLPFLEIEAKSWEDIDKAITELGLDPKDKKIFSAQQVYKLSGINENDYKSMTFDGFIKK